MHLTRLTGMWRIAQPFFDADEGAGLGGAAVDAPDALAEPSADDGDLSDHEAAFGSGAKPGADAIAPSEPDADVADRDDKGKFKPRHRAKSQEATPEDVPRIAALTKRLREAEAERDALRQPKPAAEPAAREPEPVRAEARTETFPNFDVWLATKGNEAKSFEDFIDARTDWRYDQRRSAERASDAATAAERAAREDIDAYKKQIPDLMKEYPDFDDVIATAPKVSKVLEVAAIKAGPRIAYYLATHPEEAEALSAESYVHPDNPAFPAAVASMRRYISTLVAPQRSTPTRTAADTTRAARATAPIAPKPPTLVRTGASRDADALPGDDSSLAEHEHAFGRRKRA